MVDVLKTAVHAPNQIAILQLAQHRRRRLPNAPTCTHDPSDRGHALKPLLFESSTIDRPADLPDTLIEGVAKNAVHLNSVQMGQWSEGRSMARTS